MQKPAEESGRTQIMRKALCILLAAVIMLTACFGCTAQKQPENDEATVSDTTVVSDTSAENEEPKPAVYADGKARPSNCGQLQVLNGKLCSEDGVPVILRGVSSYNLITSESFLNETLFGDLASYGANVFRLAMYTYGVGVVGYCTNGDKERHKDAIHQGVECARMQDMYVIIDWHILDDGDPNTYIEEAKAFFSEMAEKYGEYNNVLYEICNEPNGVDWAPIKSYAEEIIPIIREKDPDSVIIVGNPDWSKDLNAVMADPLDFDNILYTFHFYAASHKEEYREVVRNASQSGLPIFVTEYGITHSSGGRPIDEEEANKWIDLLEEEGISHCIWSLSKVREASAMVRFDVPKYHSFTEDEFSTSGQWFIKMIKERSANDNY